MSGWLGSSGCRRGMLNKHEPIAPAAMHAWDNAAELLILKPRSELNNGTSKNPPPTPAEFASAATMNVMMTAPIVSALRSKGMSASCSMVRVDDEDERSDRQE